MGSQGKRSKRNVSTCAGWNYSAHPTNRRLTGVTAYPGTENAITLQLCPDCLSSFNTDENLKLTARKGMQTEE